MYVLTGPAEWMGLWRHVSTTFWKFSANSKSVRQMFERQMVQNLALVEFSGPGVATKILVYFSL